MSANFFGIAALALFSVMLPGAHAQDCTFEVFDFGSDFTSLQDMKTKVAANMCVDDHIIMHPENGAICQKDSTGEIYITHYVFNDERVNQIYCIMNANNGICSDTQGVISDINLHYLPPDVTPNGERLTSSSLCTTAQPAPEPEQSAEGCPSTLGEMEEAYKAKAVEQACP